MPLISPRHSCASLEDMGRKPKPNNKKKRNGPPPWVVAKQQRERIAQMDDADRAKEIEQLHRRAALEMATRHPEPPQQIIDGWVVCIDCVTPLQPDRLKAKPDAARCIECQSIHEKKEKRRG
ncbi:TraR/DksA C4-type zinc finger protein [Pseudomonas sp. HK3]